MRTATLEKPAGASSRGAADAGSREGPPAPRLDRAILRALTLARIANCDGATRTDLKKDIFSLASQVLSPGQWRQSLDMDLGVLKADGLIREKAGRLRASEDGAASAAAFLGLNGKLPANWAVIKDRHLMAKALRLERVTARQLALLDKPDRLRALVLTKVYGLKIKGTATAAKVRIALAMVALQRAFGNQLTGGLESGAGLSAKAARLLAGQLARQPRDFGTDRRLIATLAAEAAGSPQTDITHLQTALLRKLVSGQVLVPVPVPVPVDANDAIDGRPATKPTTSRPPSKAPAGANGKTAQKTSSAKSSAARKHSGASASQHQASVSSRPRAPQKASAVAAPQRPDLARFSKEVHSQAGACAKGWSGDRKAFISHVWQAILTSRPEWALSAIEFKCMLVEAHQAGHILLSYADLKGRDNIKDVQASAIAYKNTVWHYIRVEE